MWSQFQKSNDLSMTFLISIACNMYIWAELKYIFQLVDGLSKKPMPMVEHLYKFNFIEKENSRNRLLGMGTVKMRNTCKYKLLDSKKAARIFRLGKLHYTDVLAAKERSCQTSVQQEYTTRELIEYVCKTWELVSFTADEKDEKSFDEVTLDDPISLEKRGNCWHCDERGCQKHTCTRYLNVKNNGTRLYVVVGAVEAMVAVEVVVAVLDMIMTRNTTIPSVVGILRLDISDM